MQNDNFKASWWFSWLFGQIIWTDKALEGYKMNMNFIHESSQYKTCQEEQFRGHLLRFVAWGVELKSFFNYRRWGCQDIDSGKQDIANLSQDIIKPKKERQTIRSLFLSIKTSFKYLQSFITCPPHTPLNINLLHFDQLFLIQTIEFQAFVETVSYYLNLQSI